MDHIIDGVLRFQRDVYPNEEALFRELSLGQTPSVLFIGCADSRVVPRGVVETYDAQVGDLCRLAGLRL